MEAGGQFHRAVDKCPWALLPPETHLEPWRLVLLSSRGGQHFLAVGVIAEVCSAATVPVPLGPSPSAVLWGTWWHAGLDGMLGVGCPAHVS